MVESEQTYVSMLYGRLDELRSQAEERLREALTQPRDTPRALSERDIEVERYGQRVAQLEAAEPGLCFGRLDFHDGQRRYVGRIGLFDDSGDHEPLLVDWRAPASRPFYVATAAAPDGVRRRRHLRTSGRTVVGVDDEVLDLAEAARAGDTGGDSLTNEAALLAALTAERTGRMGDIVTTIQSEQDRIIRADHRGVLVVEGGPGTGKTAVALHRAAYLLYTHRRELTSRGVLIVGPTPTFLEYIDRVLPSLGETAVLLSTVGDLYPGVRARRVEPAATAALKGRADFAEVVAAAVRDRQELPPPEGTEVVTDDVHPGLAYQREVLLLDREDCRRARDLARESGLPHNRARPVFAAAVVAALTRQLADRLGADPLGGENLLDAADEAEMARELGADPQVRAAIDRLWPILTPEQLLTDLFGSEERLAAAAADLTAADRAALRREPGGGWSPADVPLLDEAAELLGDDDRAERAEAARRRREEQDRVEYALGVLEVAYGSRSIDVEDEDEPDIVAAGDLLDASALADRQVQRDQRSVAERAAADRTWLFGHVIVDEAQELSAMAWRMLMRRCPHRSMTLVGDPHQTGDLAGAGSWEQILEPYVGRRWRLERLTVNYRTPAEVMAVAAEVLAAADPAATPPRSVRESGELPWQERTRPEELAERVAAAAVRERPGLGTGRLAVLAPADRLTAVSAAVAAAVPDAAVGPAADLRAPVVVLSVGQAKGLEFDVVLVVEPGAILVESRRGVGDLYVALSRATRRLGVIHADELPAPLGGLAPRRAEAEASGRPAG